MSLESIKPERIIDGVKQSFENAKLFLEEVYILNESGKYIHAYALCQLAMEELSKTLILYQVLFDKMNNKEINYKKIEENFKNHIVKSEISARLELVFLMMYQNETGDISVNNPIEKCNEFLENISDANKDKNKSLYVTIVDNVFQSPSEFITKEKFDKIYSMALKRKTIFEIVIKKTEENFEGLLKFIALENDGFNKTKE